MSADLRKCASMGAADRSDAGRGSRRHVPARSVAECSTAAFVITSLPCRSEAGHRDIQRDSWFMRHMQGRSCRCDTKSGASVVPADHALCNVIPVDGSALLDNHYCLAISSGVFYGLDYVY